MVLCIVGIPPDHSTVQGAWSSETLVLYYTTTQCHNLKMQGAWFSEMLVSYHITTWCHNLGDRDLKVQVVCISMLYE